MVSVEAQRAVAALLEQCAHQRAGLVPAVQQDGPAQVARMLQAEAAGRELMTALVRPDPYPEISLGATIRRLIGDIQTVLAASTPDDQIAPLLTVRTHYVAIDGEAARLVRDTAILLVLAALDDSALDIDVRLDTEGASARLTVESDRPGITTDLPAFQAIRGSIALGGGAWEAECAPHGSSWLVHVRVPSLLTQKTFKEEAPCGC